MLKMYIPGAKMATLAVKAFTRLAAGDRLMPGLGMTFVCADVATVELKATLKGTASLRGFA